jgi:hypothetical protein
MSLKHENIFSELGRNPTPVERKSACNLPNSGLCGSYAQEVKVALHGF